MKFLVDIKRCHFDCRENDIVINELRHEQQFNLVVLHVVTVQTQLLFNLLIDTFNEIVDLRIIKC